MDCISNKDYRDKNYRKEIEKYVKSHLSDKRWNHTVNVVSEAEKLCQMYGGDMEKCVTAAIFHDVVKELPNEELNALVRKFGFDEKYIDSPNLSHGKIAAALLKHEWGIDDEDIINAVSYHTTGRAGMSKTEKIVFIADAIEPTRVYNGVEAIRKATYEDLDRGCLKSLTDTVEHLKEKGVSYIDEDTLRAREWFEEQIDDFRKERDGNHMNSKDYALLAAETLDSKKAEDIIIFDIAEKSSIADYLILATGLNERSVGALIDEVEDRLAQEGLLVKSIEGKKESGWILMDYGDIIVNVLTAEKRDRYNIEKVWADCNTLSWEVKGNE
ncbi:bis(5'-nucleosyl)-tetraphosphatase (symmetrical) YqeK [Gallibacter intestinalis]|uniref:Ribosomal silencing factor RsfS n=1 Tax=Gallibacter intestinalis TaxID=2779356 RepID=A0ABR9QYJ8_9FIRM|nr:bis(5'-nucleosyl)-tetraphosphatase (symmetrical) YqeK [Gallibacter intestinalis]MBE5035650.1 bis(5'-nucleosyl)-tetraphosphatase (symmetrical) YqeK [Gallibacter intestinalis]